VVRRFASGKIGSGRAFRVGNIRNIRAFLEEKNRHTQTICVGENRQLWDSFGGKKLRVIACVSMGKRIIKGDFCGKKSSTLGCLQWEKS